MKMRFGTFWVVYRGLEDPGGGFGEGIDGTDGNVGEMESMTHVNRSSAVSHPAGYSGPGTSGTLYPFSGISYEKIVQKKDPGNDPQCALVPYIHPVSSGSGGDAEPFPVPLTPSKSPVRARPGARSCSGQLPNAPQ